jgi:sterol desaturase/sphingolipid hydroxylase (fatty acid hydroxylase superfamily)
MLKFSKWWFIGILVVLTEVIFVGLNASEVWHYAWPKFIGLMTRFWTLPYLTSLGLLIVVFLMEILSLGFHRSSVYSLLKPSVSGRVDLWVKVMTELGVHRILALSGVFMLPFLAVKFIPQWMDLETRPIDYLPNPIVAFFVWFILDDFLDYWSHRFSHRLKFWWTVHEFHHAATELNVITGTRVHFMDEGITHVFKVLPLAVMGIPLDTFIVITLIRQIIDILQHSRLKWDFGWCGRWLIVSPLGHRVHHSMVREQWDKNYGNILIIWDRLFGTWYHGAVVSENLGLAQNRYNSGSVIRDLWVGTRDCFRELGDSFHKRRWGVDSDLS